jgi:hypothetical protein
LDLIGPAARPSFVLDQVFGRLGDQLRPEALARRSAVEAGLLLDDGDASPSAIPAAWLQQRSARADLALPSPEIC